MNVDWSLQVVTTNQRPSLGLLVLPSNAVYSLTALEIWKSNLKEVALVRLYQLVDVCVHGNKHAFLSKTDWNNLGKAFSSSLGTNAMTIALYLYSLFKLKCYIFAIFLGVYLIHFIASQLHSNDSFSYIFRHERQQANAKCQEK